MRCGDCSQECGSRIGCVHVLPHCTLKPTEDAAACVQVMNVIALYHHLHVLAGIADERPSVHSCVRIVGEHGLKHTEGGRRLCVVRNTYELVQAGSDAFLKRVVYPSSLVNVCLLQPWRRAMTLTARCMLGRCDTGTLHTVAMQCQPVPLGYHCGLCTRENDCCI